MVEDWSRIRVFHHWIRASFVTCWRWGAAGCSRWPTQKGCREKIILSLYVYMVIRYLYIQPTEEIVYNVLKSMHICNSRQFKLEDSIAGCWHSFIWQLSLFFAFRLIFDVFAHFTSNGQLLNNFVPKLLHAPRWSIIINLQSLVHFLPVVSKVFIPSWYSTLYCGRYSVNHKHFSLQSRASVPWDALH